MIHINNTIQYCLHASYAKLQQDRETRTEDTEKGEEGGRSRGSGIRDVGLGVRMILPVEHVVEVGRVGTCRLPLPEPAIRN